MDIVGFGISGYRSYGMDFSLFAPLSKINLLAGQNNAGKSNALRVAQHLLKPTTDPIEQLDLPLDRPAGDPALRLAIGARMDWAAREEEAFTKKNPALQRAAELALANPEMRLTGDDLVWFLYHATGTLGQHLTWDFDRNWLEAVAGRSAGAWNSLSLALTSGASSDEASNISTVLRQFNPIASAPSVRTIEAFRQIRTDTNTSDFTPDGSALIPALARLERPSATNQSAKQKFSAINELLQSVLDDPSAHLEIARDPEEILVSRGGVILPLAHLGTGVHQVVILAAAASLFDDHLLCIEEPEVHLHPLLQRKLIQYLYQKTTNRYLIATHSAHLLDAARAEIFHVQHTDRGSEVAHASSSSALRSICSDLGYRASDLLQSNAIIWVEGPSDRIYLRHWLTRLHPELVEDIHYSIMFYGGRLLNHLTAADDDVSDFIKLRLLNQHVGILIDSDKSGSRSQINATKRRVVSELSTGDAGFAWVTDGRMIENYIPHALFKSALLQVASGESQYDGGRYSHPFDMKSGKRVDKVALARVVCDGWGPSIPLPDNLRRRLMTVISFIRTANGL